MFSDLPLLNTALASNVPPKDGPEEIEKLVEESPHQEESLIRSQESIAPQEPLRLVATSEEQPKLASTVTTNLPKMTVHKIDTNIVATLGSIATSDALPLRSSSRLKKPSLKAAESVTTAKDNEVPLSVDTRALKTLKKSDEKDTSHGEQESKVSCKKIN